MATLIDNPKRARQLARAIASDLTLYHEPKILEGIKTLDDGKATSNAPQHNADGNAQPE